MQEEGPGGGGGGDKIALVKCALHYSGSYGIDVGYVNHWWNTTDERYDI